MNLSDILPHLNAALNGLATALLIFGYVMIRQRREVLHRRVMLACFGISVLFLISYLVYHYQVGSQTFPLYPPAVVRRCYLAILFTHVVLAALVPFLAIATIVAGLKNQRSRHRRLARWTFPIWLYVSVTGVVVYLMLYQLYPPIRPAAKIQKMRREIHEQSTGAPNMTPGVRVASDGDLRSRHQAIN